MCIKQGRRQIFQLGGALNKITMNHDELMCVYPYILLLWFALLHGYKIFKYTCIFVKNQKCRKFVMSLHVFTVKFTAQSFQKLADDKYFVIQIH